MPAPEEALTAHNVTFSGHGGAEINAYHSLPAGDGPYGGVLVIHHLPGWDSGTKEITRRFAADGYNAICPNLYARQGFDVDPDDAGRRPRARPVASPTTSSWVTPTAPSRRCGRCPHRTERSVSSVTARVDATPSSRR